jgi:AraC-like DNA-binding protein
MDVLVRVGRGGDADGSVVGTMTRAIVMPEAAVSGFAGIRFLPGEAFAFLDVRAGDARDLLLTPLDAGLGEVGELVERVATEAPSRWAKALEVWLLSRLSRVRPADPRVRATVDRLHAGRGTPRVQALAAGVGVSERHLERAFAERVGVSPKLLARVLRLQALVGSVDRARTIAPLVSLPWAALAAEHGFADQAHLVREVRALAGVTPTDLVRERVSGFFNTDDSIAPTYPGHAPALSPRSSR